MPWTPSTKPLRSWRRLVGNMLRLVYPPRSANEFGDWITALHTFTYCNALHQGIKRMSSSRLDEDNYHEIVRGIFHGAMSVYLDRFLNVPPARLPGERDYLDDEPAQREELC